MNEKVKIKEASKEIHFKQVMGALLHRAWIIALVAVICAALAFAGSFYLITPLYESSATFYVNNSTLSFSDVGSISAGDLSAAQDLVNSYIVILESREMLLDVINYSGVNRTYGELRDMITAASVNGTEIFEVVVTSPDANEAAEIANAIKVLLPTRIGKIIDGTSAKVVDSPIVAQAPSYPVHPINALIGLIFGVLLSSVIVVLRELFDVTIRSEEDVQQLCPHPVLASVPDMTVPTKGGYYTSSKKKKTPSSGNQEVSFVAGGISFAAAEPYKLLRTKLQFSFADGQKCHIIGISSAMAGEGKSLSSCNLAYTLTQLNKRVLLVDCDMRRPSLNTKLSIRKVPGLSNCLTHQVQLEEVVQQYTSGDCTFHVIAAGRNPPNPIELLSCDGMREAMERFRSVYDYIILDLPPVGEVSDALVAASLVDGVLLVVRQNYCNSNILHNAVKQFEFVGSKVLGVVLNCAEEGGGRYGSRYKSYRRYANRYVGSYMKAAKKAAEQEGKR